MLIAVSSSFRHADSTIALPTVKSCDNTDIHTRYGLSHKRPCTGPRSEDWVQRVRQGTAEDGASIQGGGGTLEASTASVPMSLEAHSAATILAYGPLNSMLAIPGHSVRVTALNGVEVDPVRRFELT